MFLLEALTTPKKKQTTLRLKTTILNAANISNVHAFMEFVNKATGLKL